MGKVLRLPQIKDVSPDLIRALNSNLDIIQKLIDTIPTSSAAAGGLPSAENQRVTDVGIPVDPRDAVALEELNNLRIDIEDRLNALEGGGGGGGVVPTPPITTVLEAHVGFLETPDGSRLLFTPEVMPAVSTYTGRPIALLAHRGAYVHLADSDSPPPVGCWRWTGTQVEFPPPDVPIPNALLHFIIIVRA